MTAYAKLESCFADLHHLGHAQAMLSWDEAVIMPRSGGPARGEALAALAALAHRALTAPEVGDLLNEAEHPSTWVLPCTTRLTGENILRVPLPKGLAGNRQDCEIMIDQSRAIDNRRFVRKLKALPRSILGEVEQKLRRLADL